MFQPHRCHECWVKFVMIKLLSNDLTRANRPDKICGEIPDSLLDLRTQHHQVDIPSLPEEALGTILC